MNEIIVSTITPCFRMKAYLKKFLDELPEQTMFEKMEVVLDHNEPDEEEIQWVKEFQNKYPGRLNHIIIPKVEVIGASMNRCIQEAKGKYVTIWNVDDLRTPYSIEAQVEAIEHQGGDIAIGDYKIVRAFGEKEHGTIVADRFRKEDDFKKGMLLGPFLMFKKSLCEKAGYFDEQLTSGADYDLSLRLAYNGKIVATEKLLGYYLNEGKGASTRPNSKQPIDRAVIELRYGVFDRIDVSRIPYTVGFSIPYITSFGKQYHVATYVAGYNDILERNRVHFRKSALIAVIKMYTNYDLIKFKVKQFIKPFFIKYKII